MHVCNQSEHDTYLKPTACASFGPPASLRWRRHRTRLKLKEKTCSADGTDSTHGFRELRTGNRLTVCQRIFPGDIPENILETVSFTFGSNMLKVCIALATRNEEEPPGFGSFRGPDKTRTRPPPGEKTKAQGDQKPRALECSLRLKSPSPQPDFVRLPWHKPRPGSQVPPKKKETIHKKAGPKGVVGNHQKEKCRKPLRKGNRFLLVLTGFLTGYINKAILQIRRSKKKLAPDPQPRPWGKKWGHCSVLGFNGALVPTKTTWRQKETTEDRSGNSLLPSGPGPCRPRDEMRSGCH